MKKIIFSSIQQSVKSRVVTTIRQASSLPAGLNPRGSIAAPFTPFKDNGDMDFSLIPTHVEYLKRLSVPSLFVNGTTGEGLSLTTQERKKITEAWLDNKAQFEHMIFHIGAGNLRDSQELAAHSESVNVDAIACISPSYFKPQRVEDLVEYMRQVAEAAPNTPFYLYDINFMTQVYLSNPEFLELAQSKIPTLVGIKHSSPELNSLMRCHVMGNEKYQILLGSDDTMLPALSMGITNSVPSCFMTPLHNKIREAFSKGDMETAQHTQLQCMEIAATRAKYASGAGLFVASRAMMKMLGCDLGPPRLPLVPMEPSKYQSLETELRQCGFFDILS